MSEASSYSGMDEVENVVWIAEIQHLFSEIETSYRETLAVGLYRTYDKAEAAVIAYFRNMEDEPSFVGDNDSDYTDLSQWLADCRRDYIYNIYRRYMDAEMF